MAISRKPWLSPTNFDKLQEYVEFKADFHHVSIPTRKDPKQKWHDLPYLATDDTTIAVLDRWPVDWHTTTDLIAGSSKFITQRKKEEAKLRMEQLATKKRKETEDKAKAEHAAVKQMGGKVEEEEHGSGRSQKSPSSETEEEDEQMEQGGANPETTPFRTKCNRDPEKVGSQKMSKARKTSLNLSTLTEGS